MMLLISALLAVTAFADDDLIIADFDSKVASGVSFIPGDAVEGVSVVTDPSSSAGRGNILAVNCLNTDSSVIRTVTAVLDSPADLSAYKSLSASIFIDPISSNDSNSCFVRITLSNTYEDRFESITSIEAGEWADISADISEFMGRDSINMIEFGIIPDHIDSGIWDGGFTLDNISALGRVNAELSDRFSFESFTSQGCNGVLAADNSSLELIFDESTELAFIEFPIAVPAKNYANTLRINLENRSDADTFTVVLLKDDTSAPIREAKRLDTSSEPFIYRVNVEDPNEIRRIRLEFPNLSGSAIIRSIEFSSVYDNTPYITYGNITNCSLSADGNSISIAGELGREYVTEFSGSELCLYSLELNEDARTYDYKNNEPIARHGISTKFRFTVDTGTGNESSKFKKYVVMISTSPMIFVDTPTYITETAMPTKSDGALEVGLSAYSAYTVSNSGADSTIIDIFTDKLACPERNGYMHTLDGKQYYFTKSYVDSLDRQIGALTASGVSISLRLLIGSDEITDIVYAGQSAGYDNYLANIQTKAGYNDIRATVEFLAGRYVKNGVGGVDSFIVGSAVNAGADKLYAPAMSMTDFVNAYADIMRLIYLSASHASQPVHIYASLSDVFEYETYKSVPNRFDTSLFVDALSTYIADEGAFPWGICIESKNSYPEAKNGDKLLSVSDTDTYDELFALLSLKKNSGDRPVISADHIDYTNIGEQEYDSFSAIRLTEAAGYGKFYRYIITVDKNSPHTEAVSDAISAVTENNTVALSRLGVNIKSFGRLIENKKLAVSVKSSAAALTALPFEAKGKYTYLDFNSYPQLDRLVLSYNASLIKLVPMQSGTLAMRANLDRTEQNEPLGAGISLNGTDLKYTPVISLDIMAAGLSENAVLTLRFVGEKRTHSVNAVLSPDGWQTIYADISEFADFGSFSSIELLIDTNADTVTLYADNLTGYSKEYSSEELIPLISDNITDSDHGKSLDPTVITVFVFVIVILLSLVLILSLNSKKNDRPS